LAAAPGTGRARGCAKKKEKHGRFGTRARGKKGVAQCPEKPEGHPSGQEKEGKEPRMQERARFKEKKGPCGNGLPRPIPWPTARAERVVVGVTEGLARRKKACFPDRGAKTGRSSPIRWRGRILLPGKN